MEKPTLAPLSKRVWELLREIKKEKEILLTYQPDPGLQRREHKAPWADRTKIQKKIDDLSVKALRSGLLIGLPTEFRRPGFHLAFDSKVEYAEVLLGAGDFHPDLPEWAVKHFFEWIQMLRLQRHDARDVLRETGIISLETGVKRPKAGLEILQWELIKRRVIELRGLEDKGNKDAVIPPKADESLYLDQAKEDFQNKIRVTSKMLKSARNEPKEKRIRKNSRSWKMVIVTLVQEKLLPRQISPQAFKKMLKKRFPEYPWDKV